MLRARLKAVREDLAGLKEDLKGSYSKALADVLRAKEAEEEATADALQEELARTARPAEASWRDLPGLAEQVRKGGDEARLRLRAVLRRVVEDARVLIVRRGCWQLCAVQFFFAGGAARSYVIANQAAANHRPGKWWAGSLGPDEVPAGLDLRQPEHADRLARRLAEADLDKLAGA